MLPAIGAERTTTTALPAPTSTTGPGPPGLRRVASPTAAVAAVALLPVAAATTDLRALDGWGLAGVLGPAAWAAVLCAVLACVLELRARRPRAAVLTAATAVLVLCTTGLPSVVESTARFGTAWTHAGYVDAMVVLDGVPPRELDTRFWWPAFFAQWAWFREAGGAADLDTVLRWFPPVAVLVTTTGVFALARSVLGGTRAPWVAAWLFVGMDWIEQDYFSPQAQAVVLQLTVLTFVLGPLATRRVDPAGVPGWPAPRPGAPRPPLPRRRLVAALTPPDRPALPPRQLLLIWGCLVVCVVAVVVEHQLTPVALLGQLALLAVAGRFRGRGIVLVGLLALLLYVFVGNREWWLGNLALLVGDGSAAEAIDAGVTDRLAGDTGQTTVKALRIALAVFGYLLGAAGALAYWHRRRDLVPFGLAVIPLGIIVQGYGSEALLRIVLYALPVLVVLGTDALRALVRRWRPAEVAMAVAMAVMAATLVLVRGGNEAYQAVLPSEVALYRQVLAGAPPGARIGTLNAAGPAGLAGIVEHGRGGAVDGCDEPGSDPLPCLEAQPPDLLVVFTSTEKLGVYLQDRPPGWSRALVAELVASGRYDLAHQDGFEAVLVRRPRTPA
ncbi:hypothetical protein [Pseudonocardia humida]|uniref:Galactan 5-O-arabinofuranosyltransferase n=1 Tax=Pseudonocardia humida TaxID=2800819 RepID=A0ABT1A7Z3_9PSEU|nr:hypothetical protein [Pseudonocardia humida]MCO1658834.1 hypothetical protein [Pseudonocardia humida]